MRRRFRDIAIAVASTAISVVVLEGAVRVFADPPRYHAAPLEFDPELGFRGVPGHTHSVETHSGSFTFELDSEGFRSSGDGVDPAQAQLGVVFVGDSFLVGQGLRSEQLLTAVTAAKLAERDIESAIYNLSAIDYGTGQQLALFRRHAQRLKPDAVVLVMYPGNDVVNNAIELAERTRVSSGDYIRPYWVASDAGFEVHWTHPVRAFVRRHSRLFAIAERRALARSAAAGHDHLPHPAPSDMIVRIRNGAAPRESLEIFRDHDPGHPWSAAWRTTFALLRAFRDECDAIGARLLVVVIPTYDQVERAAKSIALDIAMRSQVARPLDSLLDWNLPEKMLQSFFEREQIVWLPLAAQLRDAARNGKRVYLTDRHLSPDGIVVAARPIVEWLADETAIDHLVASSRVIAAVGRPVRRLAVAARADPIVTFADDMQMESLADGWVRWRPRGDGPAWGWKLGARALAVVPAPAQDAELIVRGFAPGRAGAGSGVAVGSVRIVNGERTTFRLDRTGPFEVAVPWLRNERALSSEGYLALIFKHPGWQHSPLWIQQIEARAVPINPGSGPLRSDPHGASAMFHSPAID